MNIFTKLIKRIAKFFTVASEAEDALVEAINEEFHHTEPENIPEINQPDPINLVAEDHCEHLICKKCGKEYYSTGKNDSGICEDCIEKENFIGGPLGK